MWIEGAELEQLIQTLHAAIPKRRNGELRGDDLREFDARVERALSTRHPDDVDYTLDVAWVIWPREASQEWTHGEWCVVRRDIGNGRLTVMLPRHYTTSIEDVCWIFHKPMHIDVESIPVDPIEACIVALRARAKKDAERKSRLRKPEQK